MIDKETVKISQTSIVCTEKSKIQGDVTIGVKNVIHPTAKIFAEKGPIVIGDYNLIEENSLIYNGTGGTVNIGNHNIFEVGTRCETSTVGDHNVFEPKSFVGSKTIVSSYCVIGAMCRIDTDETLPPNTVISGRDCIRRQQTEKPSDNISQIEFLTKVLPNYQAIERPNYVPPTSKP